MYSFYCYSINTHKLSFLCLKVIYFSNIVRLRARALKMDSLTLPSMTISDLNNFVSFHYFIQNCLKVI